MKKDIWEKNIAIWNFVLVRSLTEKMKKRSSNNNPATNCTRGLDEF